LNISSVLKRAGRIVRRKARKGRGPASGSGKTSGRGTKGVGARSGGSLPPWYEGGATPTYRRFPKRGFNTERFRTPQEEVNVGALKRFEAGSEVGPKEFKDAGFVGGKGRVRMLGKGEVDRALTVRAHYFSASARRKIEAAGGKALEIP
jgi:large subunit ribosomal protein L15